MNMNKEFFAQQLADLEDVYGVKIAKREKQVMWNVLQHLTAQQLSDAIDSAIAQYQFRPRANQLLELAEGKQEAITNQAALEEWDQVVELAKKSWDTQIDLPMRTRLALKRIGGISVVMQCAENELHWKRKEFIDQYHEVGECEKAMEKGNNRLPQTLEDALSGDNRKQLNPGPDNVADSLTQLSDNFSMPS